MRGRRRKPALLSMLVLVSVPALGAKPAAGQTPGRTEEEGRVPDDTVLAAPELDAGRMRTGEFRYGILFRDDRLGAYTLSVSEREDGTWEVAEAATGASGSQSGTYVFTRTLEPVSAEQEGTMGPVSAKLGLRYANGRVTGRGSLPAPPEEPGGTPEVEEIVVDTALAEGTIDENMGLAAVLASPLAPGFRLELPFYDPRRGVGRLTAEVSGQETVEVPAGTYEAYRVEYSTGEAPLVVYVTVEAPRLLVKQELAGQPVEIVLEEVESGEVEREEVRSGG